MTIHQSGQPSGATSAASLPVDQPLASAPPSGPVASNHADSENPENARSRRVEIDFPEWVVSRLDREAGRIGVSRNALLKVWVAEWLDDRRSSEFSPR